MRNTFKYTLLSLGKERSILLWALAFPLIMATLFNVMFANLEDGLSFKPIPAAVIDDANYHDADFFMELISSLAEEGDNQVLDLQYVNTVEEADQLLKDGTIAGYYLVDSNADPELFTTPTSTGVGFSESTNQTILKSILDNFLRTRATVETIARENPFALTDQTLLDALSRQTRYTQEISITANPTLGSIRYFYALLGFSSIMAAAVGMIGIARTQANLSALGARRALGATSRIKTLVSTLLVCWLISFTALLLAFCYMRFVLSISFVREWACILGLLVASLMTTSLGAFIGAIPKLGESAKSGILTGLSCFFALFAGLYGTPSMDLADSLTRSAPLVQTLNPAKQVTDLFYSLYFYDGYDHFLTIILILIATAIVFILLAALFLRRQRYASI